MGGGVFGRVTYHFSLQLVLKLLKVANSLHIEVVLLLGLIELILHLLEVSSKSPSSHPLAGDLKLCLRSPPYYIS